MDLTDNPEPDRYRLTKHEGLGNDFLVLLDPAGTAPVADDVVRRLCHRRLGIGADGLLRAVRPVAGDDPGSDEPRADAVMELYNADGGRAEMSGNGIRCLVQALLLDGWAQPPRVAVATDAGLRIVEVAEPAVTGPDGRTTHVLAVDMGRITLAGDAPGWAPGPTFRAMWADAGNPHLVVEVGDPADVAAFDLSALGEKVNADVPAGANVHLLAPGPGDGEVTIRTYERGVGLTAACGTGACASAVTAVSWGLVAGLSDSPVTVTMPGGRARVATGPDLTDPVTLIGPATSVAALETPWP